MKITEVLTSKHTTLDIQKFLDEAPVDELFTVQELVEKFGISESAIKSSRYLSGNKIKYDGRNYFGNMFAIIEFRKKVI